jgi:hypothetical protein
LPQRKRKGKGIEAVAEPGLGALYLRIPWMKKLNDMKKPKLKKEKRFLRSRR